MFQYKKTTDVQRTWKEHGWTPPSDDPEVRAKWQFFKTLDTELNPEVKHEPADRTAQ